MKMTVEKPKMWEVGIAGESRLFMGSYAELVEELRGRKIQADFICRIKNEL
jgi:hypothetical protein